MGSDVPRTPLASGWPGAASDPGPRGRPRRPRPAAAPSPTRRSARHRRAARLRCAGMRSRRRRHRARAAPRHPGAAGRRICRWCSSTTSTAPMPGPGAPPAGSTARGGTSTRARMRATVAWRAAGAPGSPCERRLERLVARRGRSGVGARRARCAARASRRIGSSTAGYMYHRYPGVPVVRPIVAGLLLPGDDRSGIICGAVVDDGSQRGAARPAEDRPLGDDRRTTRRVRLRRVGSFTPAPGRSAETRTRSSRRSSTSSVAGPTSTWCSRSVTTPSGGGRPTLPVERRRCSRQVPQIEVLGARRSHGRSGRCGERARGAVVRCAPGARAGRGHRPGRPRRCGSRPPASAAASRQRRLAELGATIDALLADEAMQQRLAVDGSRCDAAGRRRRRLRVGVSLREIDGLRPRPQVRCDRRGRRRGG